MKSSILAILLASSILNLQGGDPVTLKSKTGKKIEVTIVGTTETGVEVVRSDGKEFSIPFSKLDDASVKIIKENVEKKEEEAEKAAAAEAARVPKFPDSPKSPAELPEKITIKVAEGAKVVATLTQLKTIFVEPKIAKDPKTKLPRFTVSTAFGGGEVRAFISQTLGDKVSVRYIARLKDETTYLPAKKIEIPKNGFFSEKFNAGVEEIVFFDFVLVQ